MDFKQLMQEERRRARVTEKNEIEGSSTDTCGSGKTVDSKKANECRQLVLSEWQKRSPIDLTTYRKGDIPTVYYIPNWISKAEEDAIRNCIYASENNDQWVELRNRRLQRWGGEVRAPFKPETLPSWLQPIAQSLVENEIFDEAHTPNHVLINEYAIGDGILPHTDGPSYYPLVAILSTGAASRVNFQKRRTSTDTPSPPSPEVQFELEPRSLLLFKDDAYQHYLHSIDQVNQGTRTSLTIRFVPSDLNSSS